MEKKDISSFLRGWCSALKSCSVENIMDKYAPDAFFWPTFLSRIRRSPDEIREYFEFLVQLEPACTVQQENIRVFGNIAVNSGAYTFYVIKEGNRAAVPARFTFVCRREGDDWMIVEHHSSLFPDAD